MIAPDPRISDEGPGSKHYIVSDGQMVLFLWPAEEGGYAVTSPLDPALITQGETLEEAFEMAYDAKALLEEVRREDRAK